MIAITCYLTRIGLLIAKIGHRKTLKMLRFRVFDPPRLVPYIVVVELSSTGELHCWSRIIHGEELVHRLPQMMTCHPYSGHALWVDCSSYTSQHLCPVWIFANHLAFLQDCTNIPFHKFVHVLNRTLILGALRPSINREDVWIKFTKELKKNLCLELFSIVRVHDLGVTNKPNISWSLYATRSACFLEEVPVMTSHGRSLSSALESVSRLIPLALMVPADARRTQQSAKLWRLRQRDDR